MSSPVTSLTQNLEFPTSKNVTLMTGIVNNAIKQELYVILCYILHFVNLNYHHIDLC